MREFFAERQNRLSSGGDGLVHAWFLHPFGAGHGFDSNENENMHHQVADLLDRQYSIMHHLQEASIDQTRTNKSKPSGIVLGSIRVEAQQPCDR